MSAMVPEEITTIKIFLPICLTADQVLLHSQFKVLRRMTVNYLYNPECEEEAMKLYQCANI